MTLAQAKKGQRLKIKSIDSQTVKAQAYRFGIASGAQVKCYEKIPRGPIIIKKNLQEIAIGRRLAEQIEVELV
ncbi:MAG: FeoA family protein [Bacillota bacterium]